MRDSYVLHKCALKLDGGHSAGVYSKDIALLYEQYYPYGDLTDIMYDMTGKFPDFPSSPLIEILKQNTLMEYFIEEYFLNDDIYTQFDIEENKCRLMLFFIKINNLFKRLYLVNNQGEFIELFTKIHNLILQFSREIIPADKILDRNTLPGKYADMIPGGSFQEQSIFQSLMKAIIDYSFNTSLRTKYSIFSIIHKNILKSGGGYIDKEKIREEIEGMILD